HAPPTAARGRVRGEGATAAATEGRPAEPSRRAHCPRGTRSPTTGFHTKATPPAAAPTSPGTETGPGPPRDRNSRRHAPAPPTTKIPSNSRDWTRSPGNSADSPPTTTSLGTARGKPSAPSRAVRADRFGTN